MGPKPTTQDLPMKNQCGPECFRTARNAGNRCATSGGETQARAPTRKEVRRHQRETLQATAEDVVTRLHPQPASPGDGAHGDPLLRWE